LSSGEGAKNVPYMAVPASSLVLKIGGNLVQSVPSIEAVEQLITINADRAGKISLSAGAVMDGKTLAYRLFDPRSGDVLDFSEAVAVKVARGENTFLFVAGSEEFVAAKTASFVQYLPRELSISQNFPNPWKGSTQIRYALPAGHGQILQGRLEIRSLDGRRLWDKALSDLSVGSHVLRITETNWQAGVYVYRLTVQAEKKVLHLQKRMIVSK
jgi:hypothetical protein